MGMIDWYDSCVSSILYYRDELEFLDNSMWLEPSGNTLQHADCEVGGTIVNKPGVFERSIFMKGELVAGESTMSIIPQISELYYQKERLAQCLADNSKLAVTGIIQEWSFYVPSIISWLNIYIFVFF